MNDSWTTPVCVSLVTLGALAELNLLRIFVGDWRKARREDRERRFRSKAQPSPRARATVQSRPKHRVAAFIAAPAMIGSVAFAQDQTNPARPSDTSAPSPAVALAAPNNALSAQLNLDYTTAYFYHGIIQEDTGFIIQPAAKLTVNLYEEDDIKVDAFVGTWNSIHGQKTGSQTQGDFTEYWYESDLLGGVAFTTGKFSLAAQYVVLTSPNDAYETVQELDFTLAYDDSEALGSYALHPYALLAFEVGADASDGANSDTGTYLELGIAPGFSFDAGETPVSISFPASVGLSLNDYYQDAAGDDDLFGFAQVGVKASIPLPVSVRYGKWTLNAGVSALFLGDNTSDLNAGQGEQIVGTIGLQLNF